MGMGMVVPTFTATGAEPLLAEIRLGHRVSIDCQPIIPFNATQMLQPPQWMAGRLKSLKAPELVLEHISNDGFASRHVRLIRSHDCW